MSYRIISYHVISYRIIYHIIYHNISYRISYIVICTSNIASYRIASHRIASRHVMSCHIISYIISHHITSHHSIAYHIISNHIKCQYILVLCNLDQFTVSVYDEAEFWQQINKKYGCDTIIKKMRYRSTLWKMHFKSASFLSGRHTIIRNSLYKKLPFWFGGKFRELTLSAIYTEHV